MKRDEIKPKNPKNVPEKESEKKPEVETPMMPTFLREQHFCLAKAKARKAKQVETEKTKKKTTKAPPAEDGDDQDEDQDEEAEESEEEEMEEDEEVLAKAKARSAKAKAKAKARRQAKAKAKAKAASSKRKPAPKSSTRGRKRKSDEQGERDENEKPGDKEKDEKKKTFAKRYQFSRHPERWSTARDTDMAFIHGKVQLQAWAEEWRSHILLTYFSWPSKNTCTNTPLQEQWWQRCMGVLDANGGDLKAINEDLANEFLEDEKTRA